ncbi:MAG: DUF480 domain-containing protein, partial [Xanthomonadales bacterium]|nr:DUF480 domain-containing protein [Xanthomonadales bacterium]
RASGQREDRWMHLLSGPVDREQWLAQAGSDSPTGGGGNGLAERLSELERRVAELEARLHG